MPARVTGTGEGGIGVDVAGSDGARTDLAVADEAVRPVLIALAAVSSTAVRREAGGQTPVGDRGARTRRALLTSAREIFVDVGYQGSTVAQIAERAGVSLGTFYQYFRDRPDVLTALVNSRIAALIGSGQLVWRVRDGRDGLRRMIETFTTMYAEDGRFLAVWEEVTHTDPRLAAVRRDLARLLTETIERELRRGARDGLVRAGLDAPAVARALTGMADRYCYLTYVFDPPDPRPSAADSAALLVDLWARMIGLPEP